MFEWNMLNVLRLGPALVAAACPPRYAIQARSASARQSFSSSSDNWIASSQARTNSSSFCGWSFGGASVIQLFLPHPRLNDFHHAHVAAQNTVRPDLVGQL